MDLRVLSLVKLYQMTDAQIVKMLSNGHTVKEIADKAEMNIRSMEAKLIRIRDRSNSLNAAHLVANYLRKGLIK
jgi:DNA-binding CsgD family transcriptional regulator